MEVLIGVLLGCSGSAVAAAYWRQRVELTLPCAMMANILLLYVFFLIGLPRAGVWILTAANVLLWIPAIRKGLQNRNEFRSNFFTPGLSAFLLWSVLLYAANHNRLFCNWDEFSHWGTVAKAMFMTGKLPCQLADSLNFPSYPPAMALLQYFYLTLAGGGFDESCVLFASSQFLAAFLMLGLFRARWRTWGLNSVYIMVVWLLPLAFFEFFYSVYVDAVLGMIFAYLLVVLLTTEKIDWAHGIMTAVALAFLVQVKASGTGLAVLALVVAGIQFWRQRSRMTRAESGLPIILLLAPLASRLSWKQLMAANECPVIFSGQSISLPAIWDAFVHNQPAHAAETIHAWLLRLTLNLPTPDGAHYTPGILISLLLLSATLLVIRYKCKSEPLRRNILLAAWLLPVFGVVYASTLLIYYIFDFIPYEAVRLASFTRYMNTLLLAAYLFTLVIAGVASIQQRKDRKTLRTVILLLLLLPFVLPGRLDSRWHKVVQRNYGFLRGQMSIAEQQWKPMAKPREKIILIAEGSTGVESFMLRYVAYPHAKYYPWSIGAPQFKGDIWTVPKTPEEFRHDLRKQQLIYLYTVNDYFRKNYADAFEKDSPIHAGRLYRVESTGLLRLLPVEKIDLDFNHINYFKTVAQEKAEAIWRDGKLFCELRTPQESKITLQLENAPVFESVIFDELEITGSVLGTEAVLFLDYGKEGRVVFPLERETKKFRRSISLPREPLGNFQLKLYSKGNSQVVIDSLLFTRNKRQERYDGIRTN